MLCTESIVIYSLKFESWIIVVIVIGQALEKVPELSS